MQGLDGAGVPELRDGGSDVAKLVDGAPLGHRDARPSRQRVRPRLVEHGQRDLVGLEGRVAEVLELLAVLDDELDGVVGAGHEQPVARPPAQHAQPCLDVIALDDEARAVAGVAEGVRGAPHGEDGMPARPRLRATTVAVSRPPSRTAGVRERAARGDAQRRDRLRRPGAGAHPCRSCRARSAPPPARSGPTFGPGDHGGEQHAHPDREDHVRQGEHGLRR